MFHGNPPPSPTHLTPTKHKKKQHLPKKTPTYPWNIPKPQNTTYYLWRKSFHICIFGVPGVCSKGSVGIFLEPWHVPLCPWGLLSAQFRRNSQNAAQLGWKPVFSRRNLIEVVGAGGEFHLMFDSTHGIFQLLEGEKVWKSGYFEGPDTPAENKFKPFHWDPEGVANFIKFQLLGWEFHNNRILKISKTPTQITNLALYSCLIPWVEKMWKVYSLQVAREVNIETYLIIFETYVKSCPQETNYWLDRDKLRGLSRPRL